MKVSNFAEKEANPRLKKIKAAIGNLKLSPSIKRSKFGKVEEEQDEMDLSPGMAPASPTKSQLSLPFSGSGSSTFGTNRKTLASKNWSKAINTVGYMAKSKAAIAPKMIDRTLSKYFA